MFQNQLWYEIGCIMSSRHFNVYMNAGEVKMEMGRREESGNCWVPCMKMSCFYVVGFQSRERMCRSDLHPKADW